MEYHHGYYYVQKLVQILSGTTCNSASCTQLIKPGFQPVVRNAPYTHAFLRKRLDACVALQNTN